MIILFLWPCGFAPSFRQEVLPAVVCEQAVGRLIHICELRVAEIAEVGAFQQYGGQACIAADNLCHIVLSLTIKRVYTLLTDCFIFTVA